MLLSRRHLLSRASFTSRSPPCTCQHRPASTSTFASTETSPSSFSSSSSSSTLPPLGALRRRTSPLYTVPPLPPLPPPLPSDATEASSTFNSSSTAVIQNAPGHHEQLAVLNACLASGDINRAEEVAKRLRFNWVKSQDTPLRGLGLVLPPRVHADFLKAYLASALVNTKSSSSKPLAEYPNSTSQPAGVNKARFVHKAWLYFDSLLTDQWYSAPGSGKKTYNQAIDATVFAVLFKGLTAAGPAVYNPSALTDPDNWQRPITHLLPFLEKFNLTLLDVMNDTVFDVELTSYMGKVTREEVLDVITATGQGRSGWQDWQGVVTGVKEILKRRAEGHLENMANRVQAKDLDPTKDTNLDQVTISLQTLRTNLSTLGLPDSPISLTPTARQRLLEESSYDAARQLYMHEMEELAKVGKDKERGMQSNWLQGVMFDWMRLLEGSLSEAASETGKNSPWGKEADIEPFLRILTPDKMALITIVELLRLCGGGGVSDGMKAARAILHIGKAIENEYHAQILKESFPNKEFEKELERISEGRVNVEGAVIPTNQEMSVDILWRRELSKREKEGDSTWRPAWSQGIRAKVGSILITALMDVAKVERSMTDPITNEKVSEIQPAFSHAYQYVRGLKLGVIKVNPVVAERMDSDPLRITLHPRFLPMVVTPKPWLSWNSGSYLIHNTQVMRTKDSDEQVQYLQQSDDAGNLDDIFTGLDVLGGLPWKINRRVFDVVSEVWNAGEALADIPPKDSLTTPLITPTKPDNIMTDPRAKDTYRHRVRMALQERRSAHSNRCDVNYKLEIGKAFLDETFYFPHNLDFRGRAYPIPPNLSHIGNDMCRGILRFAEAKPLGERGLIWLKIHLANMTGYDKASFTEREAFAMEHLEDVYDSADKPLEGKRWWLTAEDPWQCLATCIELAAALRSEVPTEYLCSLPIHQDGTCNGLQHYAALGGDLKGAHQVNLDIGDRPADVYSGVAAMANTVIDKECLEGNQYALLLKGKVTRKVVKQTVMTTVYGVTFIGAKKQIERQLKERGDIPAEHLYACSIYLGRIVLDSIGDVFKGATAIQTWLNRSARLIAKSIPPSRIAAAFQAQQTKISKGPKVKSRSAASLSRIPKEQMTSVVWTTPLGLPVVQPYRKPRKRQVATALQTVFIIDPSVPAEVDARAQATAFPPNFIHSLDATHMMMTALACKDKIAFASVHDSYWTHACSVDELSVTLRDTFIELHSQDILGKLRSEFVTRYAGHVVPVSKVPKGVGYSNATPGVYGEGFGENDISELYADLEKQDGDSVIPLFDSSSSKDARASALAKEKRIAKGSAVSPFDGLAEEDLDEEQRELKIAKYWSSVNSTSVGSKIVLLSDILPPVPPKGSFDLERIRDSLYFFS